ncbi:MAG: hypothetical protein N2645_11690 [Clostridia bacterium]|nr:hypothetical protein [Clostridia bacterium]
MEKVRMVILKGCFKGKELYWESLKGALCINDVNFRYYALPETGEVVCDVTLKFEPPIRKSEMFNLLSMYNSDFADNIDRLEIMEG